MAQRAVTAKRRGRLGRPLLLAWLLGLALLLGHQVIMATARHGDDMGMGLDRIGLTAVTAQAVAAPADQRDSPSTPGDRQPLTGWEECFSQVGLLPALPSLLTLAGMLWLFTSPAAVGMVSWAGEQFSRFLHPPPLAPSRRRALLQVFRN